MVCPHGQGGLSQCGEGRGINFSQFMPFLWIASNNNFAAFQCSKHCRSAEAAIFYWKRSQQKIQLPIPSCLTLIYAQITC